MTKCYESSALPSRILKTNFEDQGLREEQPLVHDASRQHHDPIKSGTVRTLSNPWDSLSLDRREATRDVRWRFCSWLFSLVWLVLPKKRKLSKVSQRYQGRSDVGGGLGCVCPHLWFRYVDPSAPCIPPTDHCPIYWLQTCPTSSLHHLDCVLIDSHASLLLSSQRKKISQTAVAALAFDIRAQALSELCLFLLSVWLQFYITLGIPLCSVKLDYVGCFARGVGNPWRTMLEQRKRQGLKFPRGIFALSFQENGEPCALLPVIQWSRTSRWGFPLLNLNLLIKTAQ